MFDAKELEKIQSDVCEAEYARLMRVGEWTVDEADAMAQHAALLAVARHVREQTLREAIKELERLADESIDTPDVYDCQRRLITLAASARETGGKPTLEQSSARLHEKYGDALAKLDDASPGERGGGKC